MKLSSDKPEHIIAVASGKGGVGKSTVAMNLAIALRHRGLNVGLLDADIYGPSQQRMLGVAEGGVRGQKDGKWLPVDVHGIKAMSMAFLTNANTPMIWRGPMASGALVQMLEKTLWGDTAVLLVDMPPGTGDIQLTLSQKTKLSGAIIVTTPQDIALLDAQKGIEMFLKVKVPVWGVIENMAVHVCSQCGHKEHIFGVDGGRRIAADYGVELLASLPLSMAMREAADSGQAMVDRLPDSLETIAIFAAADRMIARLSDVNSSNGPSISMSDN